METSRNALSVRDDTPEFSTSTGCQSVCKASGCPGCNSKRSLSWLDGSLSLDTSYAENSTQIGSYWKRTLKTLDEGNVNAYVLGLANKKSIQSIVSENSESYISFSVQAKFEDYPNTRKRLTVGVPEGFLTGCKYQLSQVCCPGARPVVIRVGAKFEERWLGRIWVDTLTSFPIFTFIHSLTGFFCVLGTVLTVVSARAVWMVSQRPAVMIECAY